MPGGIFGGMFDFNGDGHLDAMEQAAEFMFFNELINEEEQQEESDEEHES